MDKLDPASIDKIDVFWNAIKGREVLVTFDMRSAEREVAVGKVLDISPSKNSMLLSHGNSFVWVNLSYAQTITPVGVDTWDFKKPVNSTYG